jgi:hypothetical protein
MINNAEYFFMYLLAIPVCSLQEYLLRSFIYF